MSEIPDQGLPSEPHRETADFIALGTALDDPPFLVARKDDVLRFVHRAGPAASDLSFRPAAEPGEFVILYRAAGSDGEVEMARGPEAPLREAFERFSETWFERSGSPARLLRLALYVSTALNVALMLRLLFG